MKKLIFLPAILLAFYLAILCVIIFGIIKIQFFRLWGLIQFLHDLSPLCTMNSKFLMLRGISGYSN